MSDESSPGDATAVTTGSDDSIDLTRRAVLSATAGAGALVLGSVPAAASGKGGQAVVHEDDYRANEPFVISAVPDCDRPANPDGSCWDSPPFTFQCNGEGGRYPPGKGGRIPFPYWHFNYPSDDDEQAPRKLYTRDNEVRTGVTYRWPGNEKRCPGENGDETLVQTGFTAGRGPD